MPDSGATEDVYDCYRSKYGGPEIPPIATNRVLFAAESRERAWERCGKFVLHQFNGYRRWMRDASDLDAHGGELRNPGELSPEHYFVGTPDDIVESIRASSSRFGYDRLLFWARPPGMPIEVSTRSLELIARHVLPAFAQ